MLKTSQSNLKEETKIPLSPSPKVKRLERKLNFPSSNNDNVLARYRMESTPFAQGCFAQVYLAKDLWRDEKEVVIKKIIKDDKAEVNISFEIDAGKLLKHHPNIVNYIEHIPTDECDYLVFNKVKGKDLFSILEQRKFVPFNDIDAKYLFRQLIEAVSHCHSMNIAHRDIKLENILLNMKNMKLTLIDFGLCDIVENGKQSNKFCGSIDYIAPEVLLRKSYNGFQADIFSIGVVLFCLIFAEFPFAQKDRLNAIKMKKDHPKPNITQSKLKKYKIDVFCLDLIARLLNPNPEKRITLELIKRHPWMMDKQQQQQ